jgi:predicted nucleic acid-binding protein
MPFVLDASIVHAWAFAEGNPTADRARERLKADIALAPRLWWFEVRNGLVMAERRGRLTERQSTAFLRELEQLPISADFDPREAEVMAFARRHRLTVYDAAYLELALREGVPLATLDSALVNASRAEKVPVLGD